MTRILFYVILSETKDLVATRYLIFCVKIKVLFLYMFFWHDPKEPKVLAKYRLGANRTGKIVATKIISGIATRHGGLGLLLSKNTKQ